MDRIESLGNQLSQITMYDIKSMYNQAKNIVLNVSEMEAKVREATNDDAWGASSTLMQEIAQGTFNFQNFNEIMPCIYSRFMEKEASQWRQIYKALQLLEYIIKHGSERVVDDARAHISTVKMLRNFHYIDEKAKDQGINVRTRAKELVDLLGDLDRVRQERRKAKNNRNKYTGVGNDALSFSAGGSRYGGFGSDSLGGGGGYGGGDDDSYGGGGGSSSFRDQNSRREFDEYDAGDFEERPSRSSSTSARQSSSSRQPRSSVPSSSAPAAPAKPVAPPVKEVDLLGGFGDDEVPAVAPPAFSKPLPTPTAASASVSLDDDFDDFQSAPPSTTVASPPALSSFAQAVSPISAAPKPSLNVFDMINTSTPTRSSPAPTATSSWGASMQPVAASRPNYSSAGPSFSSTPTMTPTSSVAASKPASSGNFDDLWNLGLGSSSAAAKPSTPTNPTAGKSIAEIEREKAQSNMWGSKPATNAAFGNFGTTSNVKPNSGDDDLLL